MKVDFVFSFVRHPVEIYKSIWRREKSLEVKRFNVRRRLRSRNRLIWDNAMGCPGFFHLGFREWVERLLKEYPCAISRLYERFVGPERGEFCHFIGRTETLVSDFFDLMTLLGYGKLIDKNRDKVKLIGKVNKAAIPCDEWTEKLRERVTHNERLAIDRFYGRDSEGKRYYSNLDKQLHSRCPGRSPQTLVTLRRKLYPEENYDGNR